MIPENEYETHLLPTETTEAALRVFHRIARAWGLNHSEIAGLLNPPGHTDEVRSEAVMARISEVFVIYKNLRTIFPTEQQANDWVRKPNQAFETRAAIDVMIEDPSTVRRYLDSQII